MCTLLCRHVLKLWKGRQKLLTKLKASVIKPFLYNSSFLNIQILTMSIASAAKSCPDNYSFYIYTPHESIWTSFYFQITLYVIRPNWYWNYCCAGVFIKHTTLSCYKIAPGLACCVIVGFIHIFLVLFHQQNLAKPASGLWHGSVITAM